MSFWTEAFDAIADPDSGLSESGQYFADADAEARALTGPFEEEEDAEIKDDDQGRRHVRRGLWQVPKSDAGGAVTINLNGKAKVTLRGVDWRIVGRGETETSWHLTLQSIEDQSVRKAQRSTRS